jgi:hypothetical protein
MCKYFESNISPIFRLKRDLATYAKPDRVKKLLKKANRPYLAGSDVEYAHYPFVFDEGPFYGPIADNLARLKYSLKDTNRQCTALPTDLYEQEYKELFEQLNIGVSKVRSMELDLKAVLDKIAVARAAQNEDQGKDGQ